MIRKDYAHDGAFRWPSFNESNDSSGEESQFAERNLRPQRYQWRAEGAAILEKIRRAREALARSQQINKDK